MGLTAIPVTAAWLFGAGLPDPATLAQRSKAVQAHQPHNLYTQNSGQRAACSVAVTRTHLFPGTRRIAHGVPERPVPTAQYGRDTRCLPHRMDW